ncbi:hypothetical protein M406DRAFT_326591 [Cryphonectria parasitica EP155]|uniref:Glucose receptor Git3-like N-terminal domain-containing protein n=1 Tax=Cryphonectria parasitica (strain ATCC 38755 / EP155) TaxID=660469 RepID=A0A9P4YD60_CRYP1|nr:uncharacterized protein M406DRAFT_326591 [Cryphonectria parasitica EP155]KAF3771196.1 hypothetical protein M406DRAFT_326591 [Cryphonectria parasitica EP155]
MTSSQGYVWFNLFDPIVDPLVLLGSSLSLVSTFCVLLTFAIYRQEQGTFRHGLVFNLALAEFINSLNGTASGVYFVITKKLTPGALCSINGWVAQVSVQAADFSMFAIAVITLLTVTEKVYMPAVSRTKKILICLSIWIVPLATGCIAVAKGVMMPSGANWCWISASRTDLRYGLNHGWRFAIILFIIGIYSYVYYHTSRRFKHLATTTSQPTDYYTRASVASRASVQKPAEKMIVELPSQEAAQEGYDDDDREMRGRSWLRLSSSSMDFPVHPPDLAVLKEDVTMSRTTTASTLSTLDEYPLEREPLEQAPLERPGTSATHTLPHTKQTEREVKRMLLLNAYPFLYVILWIPGLVNRLLQAAGDTPSSRVLDALQAASAFIGFANAVTYGFNRNLRQRISTDIWCWWAGIRRRG